MDIQALKEKIETAKSGKAKAEGAIEQIEKQWQEEFDCKDADEVKAKISETEKSIQSLTEKRDGYVKEIEEVMEVE